MRKIFPLSTEYMHRPAGLAACCDEVTSYVVLGTESVEGSLKHTDCVGEAGFVKVDGNVELTFRREKWGGFVSDDESDREVAVTRDGNVCAISLLCQTKESFTIAVNGQREAQVVGNLRNSSGQESPMAHDVVNGGETDDRHIKRFQ